MAKGVTMTPLLRVSTRALRLVVPPQMGFAVHVRPGVDFSLAPECPNRPGHGHISFAPGARVLIQLSIVSSPVACEHWRLTEPANPKKTGLFAP